MKIIADSGSTKTEWIILDNTQIINRIYSIGYNPYYYDIVVLENILKNELLTVVNPDDVNQIYYYGSGCSTIGNCKKVKKAINDVFSKSTVSVNHDLTGAAAGLLGNTEGIACILGTGSNSCHWNGMEITHNIPSVGYLLGDEGSGTYLGMKILKGILEEKAPPEISDKYYKQFNTSFEEVLRTIYDQHQPNRFFAELSKFAGKNISNVWIQNKIIESFDDFIENNISHYPDYKSKPIAFTGSVAYHFKDLLKSSLKKAGLNIGEVLKNPIEGLIKYHQ